nr:ribonuclease H-like domain-containing protein [Tanacetum cinerariifolium]
MHLLMHSLRLVEQGGLSCKESFIGLLGRGRHMVVLVVEWTKRVKIGAGSESRPPMLNKENYVLWSSRLLRYAKSRPNGKLIYNSILNGPYVRRMILEPGDAERDVNVNETFHRRSFYKPLYNQSS